MEHIQITHGPKTLEHGGKEYLDRNMVNGDVDKKLENKGENCNSDQEREHLQIKYGINMNGSSYNET
jgi:hypothetical protein